MDSWSGGVEYIHHNRAALKGQAMATYEVHNATMTSPGRLSVHCTLVDARKAIAALVRYERASYGNRVNKLHQTRPINTMKRGDYLELTIGRNGFHQWNAFSIR